MKTTWAILTGSAVFALGLVVGGYSVHVWEKPPPPAMTETPTTSEPEPAQRWEATIYLPLVDNQGQRYARDIWDHALNLLTTEFGGLTLGAELKGCWLDADKKIHREPIQLVIVSFAHNRLGDFRRVLQQVGRDLQQEAMYVRFEQPRVEILAVPSKNSEKDG